MAIPHGHGLPRMMNTLFSSFLFIFWFSWWAVYVHSGISQTHVPPSITSSPRPAGALWTLCDSTSPILPIPWPLGTSASSQTRKKKGFPLMTVLWLIRPPRHLHISKSKLSWRSKTEVSSCSPRRSSAWPWPRSPSLFAAMSAYSC